MTDALFSHCWDVLHTVGWRNFTWQHVISRYPQWCISDIEKRFSTPYCLVVAFSASIPPQKSLCSSKSAAVFDAIMHRLDDIWPYRDIFSEAISNMPPKDIARVMWPVFAFFYSYWKSDFDNIQENKGCAGTPMPNNAHKIRADDPGNALGTCMDKKNQYALFWSAFSVGVYGSVFSFAMTHTYDETLARLDKVTTFFLDCLKKWHPTD